MKTITNTVRPYLYDDSLSDDVQKRILESFQGNIDTNESLVPLVKILQQNQPHFLPLGTSEPQKPLAGKWWLQLENTEILQGEIFDQGIHFSSNLPLGYHQLSVEIDNELFTCQVIVAPDTCYQPEALKCKEKLWGSFLQLYTLRSEYNWGVGDFGDLKRFIQQFKSYGADFLGLNPIHALFPANPDAASPYSPSSRQWLNMVYIDVHSVSAFQQSARAQNWFKRDDIQKTLAKVRSESWVNYGVIIPLKLHALRLAFDDCHKIDFAFEQFLHKQGESLLIQATFDALHQHLMAQSGEQWGWNYWPEDYQDYHSPTVQQFRLQHIDDVRFYAWLQFIATQQLEECHALCAEMRIGLYRDLAVGVTGNGAETWGNKPLYCLNTSFGAPPDMLAPQGQNWGLVPMNPYMLKQQAYQPFIELIRANMQYCGALRLDHIMSLLRLWWVPQGESAEHGAYVRYPVDDLIAILALESQRHQCLIIGEDLGTVPPEIIEKLKNAGILSYKIFYFEFDQQGQSRNLQDYPYQAMTTLSTHDLPTIHGYWAGYDFELGQQFGIYVNPQVLATLQQDRIQIKQKILQRLNEHQIPVPKKINAKLGNQANLQFIHQLQIYVAQVNSALFGFQPEDWLGMTEPVNIPGTSTEYANWRRKLSVDTETLFKKPQIRTLLHKVNQIRKG